METKISENNLEIKEYKGKYRIAAEDIYSYLGANNFSNVYNCMTRFRATIEDKNLVKIDKIKSLPLVKGIHWNGQELQIIIGGEVIKVVDEFHKYEKEILTPATKKSEFKVKKTLWAKFLAFLSGVMGPAVPVMMAAGMFNVVWALLTLQGSEVLITQINLIDDNGKETIMKIGMGNLNHFPLPSVIFYVLSQMILKAVGLYFIYNTTKFLKGNVLFALVVGAILMSRGFFPADSYAVDYKTAGFGDWVAGNDASGKSGLLLFKLWDYPIVIAGYEGSIIPYIFGGVIVTYADKWVKKWMPTTVDVIFRGLLVIGISMAGLWFLLAPVAALIELGLITLINSVAKIPYGLGIGVAAALCQPLVLTGAHNAVYLPIGIQLAAGVPSALAAGFRVGVWAQVGAGIGVMIATKNITLRKVALGGVIPGFFGVTEPIMYGINVPKVKPFLMGCLSAFVTGTLSGVLGLEFVRPYGQGLFALLAFDITAKTIGLALMCWILAIILGALFTALIYTERKNELSYFKKGVNKLGKLINNKDEINQEFENFENEIKGIKTDYKKMSKYYSDISRLEYQMIQVEEKESKKRAKMYQELVHLKTKLLKKENPELLTKFNNLNQEYSIYALDKEKDMIQNKLNKLINDNKKMVDKFESQKENLYQNSILKTKNYLSENNQDSITSINNIFWNALHSVEIGYQIEDAKPTTFKKKR